MSTLIKTTQVIASRDYDTDRRIREAVSAASIVLERNPYAKAANLTVVEKKEAANLTVVEKKDRYGYGTLTLRFLTEETL